MIGSFDADGGANLYFFIEEAPTPSPLQIESELDRVGWFDPKSRVVRIGGKVSSSRLARYFVDGYVLQKVEGHAPVFGDFNLEGWVDGESMWQAKAVSLNGAFTAGKATLVVHISGYGSAEWSYDPFSFWDSQIVQIRGPGSGK